MTGDDYDSEPSLDELEAELERPRLHGFWVEAHNVASAPRRVEGCTTEFGQALDSAERRARDKLEAIERCRWQIVDEIDQWAVHAANGDWRVHQ